MLLRNKKLLLLVYLEFSELLTLVEKGTLKAGFGWRYDKENASLKNIFLQCSIFIRFGEKLVDYINMTATRAKIFIG